MSRNHLFLFIFTLLLPKCTIGSRAFFVRSRLKVGSLVSSYCAFVCKVNTKNNTLTHIHTYIKTIQKNINTKITTNSHKYQAHMLRVSGTWLKIHAMQTTTTTTETIAIALT
ncbi:unnamed protein product [Ceratitis capitata]|uniref:(Mediterranean fruit fly) hypothetical protein n=1 Tax=Ceratitis capitata TaxID=7213 RepID=A0A811VII0_CERCA|nr:unnamed protein product [Ceratitis capitata]